MSQTVHISTPNEVNQKLIQVRYIGVYIDLKCAAIDTQQTIQSTLFSHSNSIHIFLNSASVHTACCI